MTTSVQRHDDSAQALTSSLEFLDLCTKRFRERVFHFIKGTASLFPLPWSDFSNEHQWAILVHLVVVPLGMVLYQKEQNFRLANQFFHWEYISEIFCDCL